MNKFSSDFDNGETAGLLHDGEAGGHGSPQSIPIFTRYVSILSRFRWLIIGSVAVAVAVGILITLLATPQFTAQTRIEISREGSRIVNVEGVQPETSIADQEFYQTQYGVLASRTLAERVARQLRLSDDKAFFQLFGDRKSVDILTKGGAQANSAEARATRLHDAASILLGRLKIAPIRLSRLVDINWTSPDPALSARVANAWANGFIESNLERRFEQTAYARRFLEQRLEQVRKRLEDSERQLVTYASGEAIINIPVATDREGGSQERSLVADSLATLNEALSTATADRLRAESRLPSAGGASSEALNNPTIASLRQNRAQVAAEYSRLMTQFQPDYPPAKALAAQLRQLDTSIASEEHRVGASLQNAYRDSVGREAGLSRRVEALKETFLDQRRRSIQYNIYQRDVDTNREQYNGLLQRYKEIGVAGGVGTNNVSIVDIAQVPEGPSSPRPMINFLLSLIAGLIVGVGLALLRNQIDETIVDPTDLRSKLRLPLLGTIPQAATDDLMAELRDPKAGVVEAYLSVLTSLSFSTDHGIPRSIAVTSTRPAEGKSTSAFAIAISLAKRGPTVLVDGDMRSPSVHGEVNLLNDGGLSNYLSGEEDLSKLIQRKDGEALAFLTAGPQPPNAAELLRSDRLETLIHELNREFTYIVIDAPPIMGLADAPIIASRTEGTLFVVEARGVKARIARMSIDRLRQGRAQILGAILTKFEVRRAHYGYGYDYGYGYGHASKE